MPANCFLSFSHTKYILFAEKFTDMPAGIYAGLLNDRAELPELCFILLNIFHTKCVSFKISALFSFPFITIYGIFFCLNF